MSSLKNRVLADRGFVNQAETVDTSREAVYALQGKIKKLTRMIEDSKKAFEKQRSVELNEAKDTIVALEREIFELKKGNERLTKSLAKAEGIIKQMEKEAK